MVIKASLLRRVEVWPIVAALGAVLPLFAAEIWSGFRIAQSDPVLSVIAATEQPLSVRSPGGVWAMLLALTWFALAYWQRRMTLWEAALVIGGGAAVLARMGNAWVFGLAMFLPLARQLSTFSFRGRPTLPGKRIVPFGDRTVPPQERAVSLGERTAPIRADILIRERILVGMACVGLAISAYTVMATRPPSVPKAAINATMASSGTVFADWQWAPGLQRAVGQNRTVLASGGLASESGDFWVDYLRITQGHERWSEALTRMNAQIVVLDVNGSRPAADLVRGSADWRVTHDADGALVAMRATQ